MDIISHKFIFLSISGILVLASIAALAFWGLKLGIDFTGGSLLEVEFIESRPEVGDIKEALEPLGIRNVIAQPTGERGVILRFRQVDENTHQKILMQFSKLQAPSSEFQVSPTKSRVLDKVGTSFKFKEKRFDAIGPTIGGELRQKALIALGLAVIAIVIYIALIFRKVSRPVSSWKYGMAAVAALIHDTLIPAGVFAALGNFRGVEVDTLFVTALLTIIGFSVHDTIVVFDRIRENLLSPTKVGGAEPYAVTVNRSINQTIGRSLSTSFTVILVISAIFFFGGESTRYLALALIIGIFFGTYSSIFVASPLLVIWQSVLTSNKK